MRKAISYGRQTIEEDDIKAVTEALRSGMLTQGPLVEAFEESIARYTGARYAVACSNGTAALHLACMAAGIGPGDKVITSPITFLASANCALYVGATPVFADIDPRTFNIDPGEIERKIKADPEIKAIIPVHFAGLPCDMEAISGIARKRGIIIIEDGCHALGASWRDKSGQWHKAGSCVLSDMTVFSFHPVKSITTGEGGAVTTNDENLYRKLKTLRSHGVTRDAGALRNPSPGPWYYEMHAIGYNYRLSDIQCALGISQMKRLDEFIGKRNKIASKYSSLLSKYPFITQPSFNEHFRSAFHLYPVQINFYELGVSKGQCFEAMRGIGINLQVHYIPVHLQPYYRDRFGYRPGDFPRAEHFYEREASLPIYPLLTDEEAGAVAEGIISTLAYSGVHR